MRFALVEDKRTSPSPGLSGSCPACGSAVLPKCGSLRVHHWAHRGKRVCDRWWERETEWHRKWKDKFPPHWQEVIRSDTSGEKHIADVRTDRGLTVEFQYSHLNPHERVARENFHGNMVWVVSGARRVRDLPRFVDGKKSFMPVWRKGVYVTPLLDAAFPRDWLNCAVPVFFDLENAPGLTEQTLHVSRPLWCLLPGRAFGLAVVLQISREAFVGLVHEKTQLLAVQAILEHIKQTLTKAAQAEQARIARLRAAEMSSRRRRTWRPFRGRRPFRRF